MTYRSRCKDDDDDGRLFAKDFDVIGRERFPLFIQRPIKLVVKLALPADFSPLGSDG